MPNARGYRKMKNRSSSRFSSCLVVTYLVLFTINTIAPTAPASDERKQRPCPPKFHTVSQVIEFYGKSAREKLKPLFESQGVSYPPKRLTWIALKQEKLLLIFAPAKDGRIKRIKSYQIIGASGGPGPKLKDGDKQVPEGFYKLSAFRPNLIAHIGLAVNYPNQEDLAHAKKEKRKNLGCDILIHGSRWSTGCLALGNPAIEELFVLAYDAGLNNIDLVFSPCNLLLSNVAAENPKLSPKWLPELYQRLRLTLKTFPI